METVPVRRTTSVPLRHNLKEGETNSVERDTNSAPILPRNTLSNNSISDNIPLADSVARTLSRGLSSPYQIGNYKLAPKRPSETKLPNVSQDTKPQIRTPLLANRSIGLPTFQRPHSNPNLTNEKRTYTSSDVIGTKKSELEPTQLNSKSVQSVKRFSSAPGAIPATNTGIYGYNTLTSTPNEETRTVVSSREITTPILTGSADKPPVLESTVSEMRKLGAKPPQPDYLQLIQNLLTSKKSNFRDKNDTSNQSYSSEDSIISCEVAQIVNEEFSSLSELGIELANQIRSRSESGTSTQRHNSSGSLGGKSTSVATVETVLEALRYNPRQRDYNRSEINLKTPLLPRPTEMRYKSAPSLIVSRATYEPPNEDTFPRHKPSQLTQESSAELVKEDSFQILSGRTGNTRNGPIRVQSSSYDAAVNRNTGPVQFQASGQMSSSSSVSFIKLNSQLSQDEISKRESCDSTPDENIHTSPTQTNELALSTPKVQTFPENNLQFDRFNFSDFLTPTNPFMTQTFLTEISSQQSLLSVQPHTRDIDTFLAPFESKDGTHEFPIENIPSHYKIDLCRAGGETEEDTFLPLTPSEFRTEESSLNRELEIVSLPQSSVTSPTKLLLDTIVEENIVFEEKKTGIEFDIQNETSFEYIQRFVSEVKKFMEKRTFQTPHTVSRETTIPVPPGDTTATPPLPSNLDQLITDMARQKLDELWENYLMNKSQFSYKQHLTRRHNKVAQEPPDSTLSGYNTKLSSSFSDTTLFVPRHHKPTHKNHLVLKPRYKRTHRREREVTTCVASLATQTHPVIENKDSLTLSVKQNSVTFLVKANDREECIDRDVSQNVSLDMTLQEACHNLKPRFITNSNLRQVVLRKVRMCRREMAEVCLVPKENKSVQTKLEGNEIYSAGTFIPFRRKLTREEIQNQNRRWRSRFPNRRRIDQTKVLRERGHLMRSRVKTYQREILDPVRRSLLRYRN